MKIIRWILFIPVCIITSVLADVILKFIFKGISFLWDSAGAYSSYGQGIESDGMFVLIFMKFLIPAISYYIAVYAAVFTAPNNRKTAVIILVILNIIISILYLFTIYGSIPVSISSLIGTLMAYFNLKEKETIS